MKKYRCKIETPIWSKGDVVTHSDASTLDESQAEHPELYPDLFEQLPDRWVPKVGDEYWWIGHYLDGVMDFVWNGDDYDLSRLGACRVYKTKQKAQAVRDKILKLLEEEKEL